MKDKALHLMMLLHLTATFVDVTSGDLQSDIIQAESKNSPDLHSRKRRYVVFPEGSTFTFAFCVSIKAHSGPDNIFTEGVNWALSYDLPNETIHNKENGRFEFPILVKRHKRNLYTKMEKLIETTGIDGRKCVLKTLCETAQQISPRKGIIEEVMRTLFTYTSENPTTKLEDLYEDANEKGILNYNCNDLFPCPISILQLGLGFGSFNQPEIY